MVPTTQISSLAPAADAGINGMMIIGATHAGQSTPKGCLRVLHSGAPWCDLSERYWRWKSVHKRSGDGATLGFGNRCSRRIKRRQSLRGNGMLLGQTQVRNSSRFAVPAGRLARPLNQNKL